MISLIEHFVITLGSPWKGKRREATKTAEIDPLTNQLVC